MHKAGFMLLEAIPKNMVLFILLYEMIVSASTSPLSGYLLPFYTVTVTLFGCCKSACTSSIHPMSHIFSVRELTGVIKQTLEGQFPFVWVKGQVANLSRPASGHMYFSLKDADATLSCVWFKGSQRGEETFDPLTGEVFEGGPRPSLARTLQEGQEVLCAGRMNVYPPRGSYQLVVEIAQNAGLGQLYLEFEECKRKLAAKGYFTAERKRALPYHPQNIAVITAPTGAAIQDFLRIAGERGWGANIRIYPSLVQGNEAPAMLVSAIQQALADAWADVVVLIRGGGSLEDLWAFNDERVAEAIFTSSVPVLAGIGHEVDHTIADMTADVRAATPTHAAQLLWPDRAQLMQSIDELEMRLTQQCERSFLAAKQSLETLYRGLTWLSPERQIARWDERFLQAGERLQRAWDGIVKRKEASLLRLTDNVTHAFGPQSIGQRRQVVEGLLQRLHWAGDQRITLHEQQLERLSLRLEGANPEKPLERGYSLVRLPDGNFLRSISEMAEGDFLSVVVHDGEAQVIVDEITSKEK